MEVKTFEQIFVISLLYYYRNVDPEELDQSGQTSLHIACQVGRAHNVEVLLKHAFGGKSFKSKRETSHFT